LQDAAFCSSNKKGEEKLFLGALRRRCAGSVYLLRRAGIEEMAVGEAVSDGLWGREGLRLRPRTRTRVAR
jgi:hypothetical protein